MATSSFLRVLLATTPGKAPVPILRNTPQVLPAMARQGRLPTHLPLRRTFQRTPDTRRRRAERRTVLEPIGTTTLRHDNMVSMRRPLLSTKGVMAA
jgi:hypothetical protein